MTAKLIRESAFLKATRTVRVYTAHKKAASSANMIPVIVFISAKPSLHASTPHTPTTERVNPNQNLLLPTKGRSSPKKTIEKAAIQINDDLTNRFIKAGSM